MTHSNDTTKREILTKIDEVTHSSKGRNILSYVIFLCIAFVFWLLLALNDEIQKEYSLPIQIVEVPDSITLLDETPENITVNVKDKGSSLLRYSFENAPKIKLKYKDISNANGRLLLSNTDIASLLRATFSANAQIISFTPDSIKCNYTALPGKRVGLRINTNVTPNPQFTVFGNIRADVDSLLIYSQTPLSDTLIVVNTETIFKINAKDTIRQLVRPILPSGTKSKPDVVLVTVPVEPFISKKASIPIDVETADDRKIIIFPSKCDISYLTPMSKYGELSNGIKLSAKYDDNINGSKIPVEIISHPDYCQNIIISPDSVEYIIEER